MNIPETLMKLLGSGDAINSISAAVGLGREEATKAVSASVPALLAAFAQTASTTQGAQQLANAVSTQDPSLLDNVAGMLSSKGSQVAQQGSSLLSSLLGSGQTYALAGIISRFSGVSEGAIAKVLGILGPLVLGFLGRQSSGSGASGLANLLNGQKDFIKSAMPAGLTSMMSSGLPGFGDLFSGAKRETQAAAAAARSVYEYPASTLSPKRWLVPALVALCLLGLLVMWARHGRVREEPAVPEAIGTPVKSATGTATSANFVSDTSRLITDATKALASVKDSASADAAVEKLKEINGKLESAKSVWTSLPENTRTLAQTTFGPLVTKLEAAIQPVLSMPAIGDTIRPYVNELLKNLRTLTSPP